MLLLWIQHLHFEATVIVMLPEGLHWVFVDEDVVPAPQCLTLLRSNPASCTTPGEAWTCSFTRGYGGN